MQPRTNHQTTIESIDQYLSRGGSITYIAPQKETVEMRNWSKSANGKGGLLNNRVDSPLLSNQLNGVKSKKFLY